ncbi:MAG: ChbG/HpnK family deacetylase [Candidatus Omnitrophica bacterium]|nr:ChbG/HpnK family deacetylase [Candidatus Omnitrophota bacterium]
MNKYLIINADDYGFSEKTNQGIIEAYTKGVVSDLSIMAVGVAFEDGITRLKENSITTAGIHVCLTSDDLKPFRMEYFPKNCFHLFRDIVSGKIKKQKIYAEIKAQVKKAKEQGLSISHMDSHEHVHMFFPITDIFIKIAEEENIPYIRYPNEKIRAAFIKEPVNFIRSFILKTMCLFSKKKIKRRISGEFFGHFHSGRLTKKDVQRFLKETEKGASEIGCHPGSEDKDPQQRDQWRKNGQNELNIFTDKEVIEQIKTLHIKTISFKDLGTL